MTMTLEARDNKIRALINRIGASNRSEVITRMPMQRLAPPEPDLPAPVLLSDRRDKYADSRIWWEQLVADRQPVALDPDEIIRRLMAADEGQ